MASGQHLFSMVPTTFPLPNGGDTDSSYLSSTSLSGLELVVFGGNSLVCGKEAVTLKNCSFSDYCWPAG